MFKQKTHIEIEKDNRTYHFICDNDSPLGELHDVIYQLRGLIVERINEVAKAKEENQESNIEENVNDDKQAAG